MTTLSSLVSLVPMISVSASLTSSLSPPSLWMSARWLCLLSLAPELGPRLGRRGELRLTELELRPGRPPRVLAPEAGGPGSSELVLHEEKEELLCFLPSNTQSVN